MAHGSSSLVLIGWDDILCRPIYRRDLSQTKPTTKLTRQQTTTQNKCKAATSRDFPTSAVSSHSPLSDEFQIEGITFIPRNKNDDDHQGNANHEDGDTSKSRRCRSRENSLYQSLSKGATLGFPNDSTPQADGVHDVAKDKCSNVGFNDDFSPFEHDNSSTFEFHNDNIRSNVKKEAGPTTSAQTAVDRKSFANSPKTQCIFCPSVGSNHSNRPDEFGTSNIHACETTNVSDEKGPAHSSRKKLGNPGVPPDSLISREVFSSPLNEPTASVITGYARCGEVDSDVWIGCKTSPIDKEDPKDEISIQSPMLLECDRKNAKPFIVETDDISFLGDFESDIISLRDNPRSYGRSSKPNWVSRSYSARKSNDSAAHQQLIVGWDDVKCRPIYHVLKPNSSSEKVESSYDATSNTTCVGEKAKAPNRPQKKRMYASTFKKSRLFKAARHNMDIDLPSSSLARRVTMENVKQVCKANRLVDASNDKKNNSELDFVFDLESNNSRSNLAKLVGAKDNNPRREAKIGTSTQPTSMSTIKSARDFFHYLDSNHHLTIIRNEDETNDCERNAPTVIRTTRRIRHCGQLREEYNEYSKMADATGIDPISIEDFARHWNMYFTERGVIRDGLLDED